MTTTEQKPATEEEKEFAFQMMGICQRDIDTMDERIIKKLRSHVQKEVERKTKELNDTLSILKLLDGQQAVEKAIGKLEEPMAKHFVKMGWSLNMASARIVVKSAIKAARWGKK